MSGPTLAPAIYLHWAKDETGAGTLEGWCGERKITAYFDETPVNVIRVWGQNIETEMQDHFPTTIPEFIESLKWLVGGQP